MSGKTVLLRILILDPTGNTGLGLEVVRSLAAAEHAYEIIIGCRTVSKGEEAIATVKSEFPNMTSSLTTVQADLSSDSSLEAAVQSISTSFGRLDVLINNGGASFDAVHQAGKMTLREAWNASWDTNVSGTQVLTTLSIPLLLKSANPRLLFVTSGTSSLQETERFDGPVYQRLNGSPDKGWPKPGQVVPVIGYRSSKTGLNMLMRDWHRILLNDGVKVWAISPGFLATGLGGAGPEVLKKVRADREFSASRNIILMFRQMGAKDPSEGGRFILNVVEGGRDQDVGKVIRADMVQAW